MESSFVIDDAHNMRDIRRFDGLSGLPDSILHRILSSVPTKYVVQMSTFSRRWRYLWTSMPTLNIDDNLFSPSQIMLDRYSVESMRFVGFVYKVLLFRDMSHIKRFCLTLSSYDIYPNSWIDMVTRKNVEELYLDIYNNGRPIKLPDCLFTCKSIVSLELNLRNSQLSLSNSICFTRLRTLHLDLVSLGNDTFGTLLFGCPVLESLILERCQWSDEVVVLSSPTIRNLFINNIVQGQCRTVEISIPNLMSLNYIDFSVKDFYFLQNPLSLVDVFIRIKKGSSDQMTKLLRGVSNARCVTLLDFTLEILSDASRMWESDLTFHNLNKLILTVTDAKIKHFLAIACLLRVSPILESLIIDIKPYYDDQLHEKKAQESTDCQESKDLSSRDIFLDRLKVVEIRCFRGTESEFELVKLLLRNASTMDRLIISISGRELHRREEISEKLIMFQRASDSCNISLS